MLANPIELPETEYDNNAESTYERELMNKINQYQKENKRLLYTIDNLKKTVNNFVLHSKKKNNFDMVKREVNNYKSMSYADIVLEIPDMQKEIAEKTKMISELQQEVRGLKVKNDTLSKDNDKLLKENEILKHDNESQSKSLSELTSQSSIIKEQEKTIKELTSKNEYLKSALSKIKASSKDLMAKNESQTKTIEELSKQVEDLKSVSYDDRIKNLLIDISDKDSLLSQQAKSISCLQNELDTLKSLHQENTTKLSTQNESITNNTAKINELISHNDDLSSQLNEAHKKISQYENIVKDNESTIESMKETIDKISNDNNTYENELKNMNERLIMINTEKVKNENYYLDAIANLQKEKNYYEQEYDNIIHMKQTQLNNELIDSTNDNRYNDALNNIILLKKEIEKHREINQQMNNDLNELIKENNFYFSIIKKITTQYLNDLSLRKNIQDYVDIYAKIVKLRNEKKQIKEKLSQYNGFISEMNNNKGQVQYDYNHFSEISILQNNIINIENSISALTEEYIRLDNIINH